MLRKLLTEIWLSMSHVRSIRWRAVVGSHQQRVRLLLLSIELHFGVDFTTLLVDAEESIRAVRLLLDAVVYLVVARDDGLNLIKIDLDLW